MSEARLASEARGASAVRLLVWCLRHVWRLEVRLVSKAPSFKPEGLSSLPVSPGPELVTVVRGLKKETLDAHTEPEARTQTKPLDRDSFTCTPPVTT